MTMLRSKEMFMFIFIDCNETKLMFMSLWRTENVKYYIGVKENFKVRGGGSNVQAFVKIPAGRRIV